MAAGREGIAIYALTAAGAETARRLRAGLGRGALFLPRRLAGAGEVPFARLTEALTGNWGRFSGHVLFCAAGIAVRAAAGLIRSKAQDPAVVVVDQRGDYAVSLLSGHLGGANALARRVAEALGGRAVITTATDIEGLPSLEMVAAEADLEVENLTALAGVSRRLLDGRTVPVFDPEERLLPRLAGDWPGLFESVERLSPGRPGVLVGWRTSPADPAWLVLRPACLAVGVGCNRNTGTEEIAAFIEIVFAEHDLAPAAIGVLASASAKRDEAGLLEAARRLGREVVFFENDRLNSVAAPNPSAAVERHMGVESVCEAAAILAAGRGRLIVEKQKRGNVTVAVALANSASSASAPVGRAE